MIWFHLRLYLSSPDVQETVFTEIQVTRQAVCLRICQHKGKDIAKEHRRKKNKQKRLNEKCFSRQRGKKKYGICNNSENEDKNVDNNTIDNDW